MKSCISNFQFSKLFLRLQNMMIFFKRIQYQAEYKIAQKNSLILIVFEFFKIKNNILVEMMKILSKKSFIQLLNKPCFTFSGGHHPKPFDWRDDHELNPYYELDPRALGTKNSYQYSQPYEGDPIKIYPAFPKQYNPKDLTINYIGSGPLKSVGETNLIEGHSQNLWDDIAHEWDYESQDLDFQPQSFKSQHFRKRGGILGFVVIAFIPIIYVVAEVVYNQMVDGDGLKFQRPPPLNYPDDEDTPDTQTYQIWKSPEFTYLHDAGILKDPYFDIIDGKKIYTKWSGVNQPGVAIK